MSAHHFRVSLQSLALLLGALLALVASHSPSEAAKPFPVDQFSWYLSDYDMDLAKVAKELKRTEPEIQADLAAARAANNSRLAASSLEQLLTKQPTNGTLWLDLAQELSVATPINDSDGYTLPSKLIGAALKYAIDIVSFALFFEPFHYTMYFIIGYKCAMYPYRQSCAWRHVKHVTHTE